MIEHAAVVNLITSQTELYKIDATEKILLFSNYFFDASIEQMFLALLNGGTLVVIDKKRITDHVLPSFIEKHEVTHLDSTPGYLDTLPDLSHLKTLKRIVAGGEVCSIQLARRMAKYCDFYNAYGPTENTVTSTIFKYSDDKVEGKSLPIGKPIRNTSAYILNENLKQIPIGEIGELCLSGYGLARGYLNRPELNSEKFVPNPFETGQKLYKTGDLAKWTTDGNIEFIGRKDEQVKIRGYRIELGEVESALNSIEGIKNSVVVAGNLSGNEKRLIAYVQPTADVMDNVSLRSILLEVIPEYMVPASFMWMDNFPLTRNGKIDKKNLPKPEYQRPASAPLYKKPKTDIEKKIALLWSELLTISNVGINDNFFEMGGTSLLVQKMATILEHDLNKKVPVAKIYQNPTIAELSKFFQNGTPTSTYEKLQKKKKRYVSKDVAIIGLAGRFPGANTIDELWEVLEKGEETISFFSRDELDESIPESLREDPLYVGARGIVPLAKEFDAKFFGMNPKLAQAMDPQQRLFMEITWETLEQSGYLPKHFDGRIGVYAGTGGNTYYVNNVLSNEQLVNQVGSFQANTVNDKDYIAARTAYHLNLKGPAISVYSACSTSLLAIAEAVEAIRSDQCDVAIAGAASVTAPMYSGHLYQEGSMLSSNGHCRPFDAEGTGTVFSDGAGVVLLKNLEDAKKDNDRIYGVIKGIGINNDGGDKGSFTAPSVQGQAGAIQEALVDAGVEPTEISYIEAHGTATPLGDPIELEGLHTVFGKESANKHCAIGSIKSNMGHLTAAAGVAGLIKTVLAMKYGKIPASIGYDNPNPNIDFENSPFYVNHKLNDWICDGSKKAGISSFGVGGTNVHVVVEEYTSEKKAITNKRPIQLLHWSAKSEFSLNGYQKALANHFKNGAVSSLENIAYSLSTTKDVFKSRSYVVVNDTENAHKILSDQQKTSVQSNIISVESDELAFLFPGQGAQYIQMGRALYEHETVFRESIIKCADFLQVEFGIDILEIVYPKSNDSSAEDRIRNTKYTQPALFAIEYALSQLWFSWGIKPTLLCGHSIGEFCAAHLAGIFSLEEALKLVTIRGKLISDLPGGSMLSIRSDENQIKKILPPNLSMAAINSDRICVVSGDTQKIEAFASLLKEKNIASMLLATSHAFHSSMMNPILDAFKKEVEKIVLKVPRIPIVSTVTGTWMSDSEATDPQYWTDHLREAVRFSDALETILQLDDPILLEVGPGKALTALSNQKKNLKPLKSVSCLTVPKDGENAYHTMLSALGELWINGVEPDWKQFYGHPKTEKEILPSYVFDRKPSWVYPPKNNQNVDSTKISLPEFTDAIKSEPAKKNIDIKKMRKHNILEKIGEIISNTSGIDLQASEFAYSFLELGLDSLSLTQMALNCKNEFNLPITFRQLNDELTSPEQLSQYLDEKLPEHLYAPNEEKQVTTQIVQPDSKSEAIINSGFSSSINGKENTALNLMAQQIQLLAQQIELMQGGKPTTKVVFDKTLQNNKKPLVFPSKDELSEDEKKEHKKPFGASPRIEKKSTDLSTSQQAFLEKFIEDYNKRTIGSKTYTQKNRAKMADPRVVSGFKPLTKELVYPIVIKTSAGNRLWDLDNNEYLDTLNGFGSCFFGHQPDFIKKTLHKQVDLGFEVGPQHPLAGEVCDLLCEFTGHERAGLCNTGSEAVLGAMRIARTVTGRSLIVAFKGSYHGINDEALVRGSKKLKTFPAAAGVLPNSVQNILVLEYGTDESLEIIRNRANELAAVLVEPVQSRRPEFQPVEFLKKVRKITKESETVLIFDEIITGFRMHPGGTQALFDIKADVATYGKVIGGGISIGAILGSKKYMDALDGGFWNYGDDSFPEVGVTYFAGTFVRHPLALASTKASLTFMKEKGPSLQNRLNEMTERFAVNLNREFKNQNLPLEITYFGSLWRLAFTEEIPYSELLFVLMRHKGIHIWDGFPCFLTDAYVEDDMILIKNVLMECLSELVTAGFISSTLVSAKETGFSSKFPKSQKKSNPPVRGARLGMDEEGNPAWFVEDHENEGEYLKIGL